MKHLLILASASLAACGSLDDDIDDVRCDELDEMPSVILESDDMPAFTTGDETVEVRGTARHALGMTIRRVTVAGLEATSDSFNFAAWSVDVPADLVVARVPANAMLPATVKLRAIAYDTCRGEVQAGAVETSVRVAP